MTNELVASLKGDTQDDPWLVIHVDTIAALKAACQQVITEGVGAVIQEAQASYRAQLVAAKGLGAVPVGSTVPAPTAAAGEANVTYLTPPAPAPVAAPTGPPAPTCRHGEMSYVTSKPGANKVWKAWMCNAEKGSPDKCEPQWIR